MTDHLDELGNLARLHLRYGAGIVGLDVADVPHLPPGWRIVTRRWGFRCWDALIRPPGDGPIGWRLGGDFAPSRRKAVRRAVAEVQAKLADDAARRERWKRGVFTEDEELILNWRAATATLSHLTSGETTL